MSVAKQFQSSFKTVLKLLSFSRNILETFLLFSPLTANIRCLCKTAVYDAVNRSWVNKYGDNLRH